MNSEDRVFVLW